MGVKLTVKGPYKSEEQARAEILQAVEARVSNREEVRAEISQTVEARVSNRERIAHTDLPRLTELKVLPKDPPKQTTGKLSATGFNGV